MWTFFRKEGISYNLLGKIYKSWQIYDSCDETFLQQSIEILFVCKYHIETF